MCGLKAGCGLPEEWNITQGVSVALIDQGKRKGEKGEIVIFFSFVGVLKIICWLSVATHSRLHCTGYPLSPRFSFLFLPLFANMSSL